ncbi:MAG: hypothetical protein JXA73_03070 [Acidobacteria bacterium]|nr:hypothetical protein [Acidobacteriota bacterium]
MTGKPHQSSLIPHENEIINLRCRKPPVPYTQIAELLREKYDLTVQAPAIFKFIKVRSRGRKVYSYGRNVKSEKPAKAPAPARAQGNPDWNFKYSERYNLTRLPPEVAAARRKKLEEEGH